MNWVALASLGTALGTWALALITFWLVKQQLRISQEELQARLRMSQEELQVRNQLSLENRFDSAPLVSARKALAAQFLQQALHKDIDEDVMNFFESLGMFLRRGYLDPELTWAAFSFNAIRWWSACKDYITAERDRQKDETIFAEFQRLTDRLYEIEERERRKIRSELEPSPSEIQEFLEGERDLRLPSLAD
jgi:hypothetical protein